MTVEPRTDIIAGSAVTLTVGYVCGEEDLPAQSAIGISWRLPFDWGEPQFDEPDEANHVSVEGPPGTRLSLDYAGQGGIRPWNHLLTARLDHGRLSRGDEVTFRFGGTRQGTPGWEAPTAIARRHRLLGMIRVGADGNWKGLRPLPELRIVPGAAKDMVVTAPSDCVHNEELTFRVVLRDAWGNPTREGISDMQLVAPHLEVLSMERASYRGDAFDAWQVRARFSRTGRHRITASARAGALTATGNPIDCHASPPTEQLFWGDLHAGQCDLGCGLGSLDEFYWYAKSISGLQFASHQANDVYVTASDWRTLREAAKSQHEEGSFVSFLGCEWTALPRNGGDRNVVYLHDQQELHRADRWYEERAPDAWSDAPTPVELFHALADVAAATNLHAGGFTSDLDFHDPRLDRLVEVHSTHGTSTWLVEEALERGYKLGISAGTDGIAGRPGSCSPGRRQTRNVGNGCMAVYARDLSRQEIWRAVQRSRCYGTSGERIRLDVTIGKHGMGDTLETLNAPEIRVDVAGTAPIERLILRRGSHIVATHQVATADEHHPHRYRLLWSGTKTHGTSRAQAMNWDGHLHIDGGSLTLLAPLGFFAADRLEQVDPSRIAWTSTTAGNLAGFTFDAHEGSSQRFEIATTPLAADVDLPPDGAPVVVPAGDQGYLRLERAPSEAGPMEIVWKYLDQEPIEGTHAYWFEVVQMNGGRAWSSPIYVVRSDKTSSQGP